MDDDHLDTPRAVTTSDGTGTILWSWSSDPFGTTAASGSIEYNLRFPGQYYDGETGLHYNYFRDYDPAAGRYRQSDPAGLDAGINPYSYVKDQSLTASDWSGLAFNPRRPGTNKGAKGEVSQRQGGKCGVCGAGIEQYHHEAPYTIAELRQSAQELQCAMGESNFTDKFVRRIFVRSANDTSILTGFCIPCHLRKHR